MSKTISLIGFVLLTCFLGACHKNPLNTKSVQSSSRFLINASVAAEKSLHLGLSEVSAQRAYLNCMDGKNTAFDCKAFYQAMVDFTQSGAFPEFKAITVADLTDKSAFDRVREEYEQRFFFNNLEN
ncbi:protein LvrD [Legionella lytica]|uniref:Protein LvrD n=1 Tax=Legionella lytica TaxID=96232 RepID=A0ABW8DBL4_9GAMM